MEFIVLSREKSILGCSKAHPTELSMKPLLSISAEELSFQAHIFRFINASHVFVMYLVFIVRLSVYCLQSIIHYSEISDVKLFTQ